ncbi:MAG TPA: RHS repeat-associated core domain-containing protein [Mycobacteriales bacterium]|nr:RHS repeat-associated core domain-containing protein [Egibacteraceae bacterium]HVM28503.1 RHS repeat-associated core domain-containing protein [Mycobacteriales bacterium]
MATGAIGRAGTPAADDRVPDTSAGQLDYGWLGQHQRPYEHASTIATIEMGARQYVPALGRFLSVDPVEGGSANDYDYVAGNPVGLLDLDGEATFVPLLVMGANIGARWLGQRAAQYLARQAVRAAARRALRDLKREGYQRITDKQRVRSFAYGLEMHRRTADLLGRGVRYGKASGPKGAPRRFSPDFRFGRGGYGGFGRIGVELKFPGGKLVTYSGIVR